MSRFGASERFALLAAKPDHYALVPKPRGTPIYDRLIRGLTARH